MESILYDLHLMEAAAESDINKGEYGLTAHTLRASVFNKHGVNEADFDSSMVYYYRHTERLHIIYENVAERMKNEALALGASANDVNRYGVLTTSGDTANIWAADPVVLLTPEAPGNVFSFSMPADTSFHKGDRFLLNFDAQFVYQDGMRDCVAMLAVKFQNDSVASRNIHLSNSSHYSLEVSDTDLQGIKEIRGFLYLSKGRNDNEQTLKLFSAFNFQLVRMHKIEKKKTVDRPQNAADSTQITTSPSKTAVSEPQDSLQNNGK